MADILIRKDANTLIPKLGISSEERAAWAVDFTIYDINADGSKSAAVGPTRSRSTPGALTVDSLGDVKIGSRGDALPEWESVQSLVSEYESAGSPKFARPYTWATLPAAASYIGFARVTDIGLHGSLWYSDGSTWGLVNGKVVLEQSAVAKAAHTGTTSETLIHTYAIPAGLMGLNGEIEVLMKWTQTNSANTKTYRVRLGGISGTAMTTPQASASVSVPIGARIQNRGSASSQIGHNGGLGWTASTNAWSTGAVDTSAAVDLAITATLASAGESATLEAWQIILRRP